jgi:hypothetical protein
MRLPKKLWTRGLLALLVLFLLMQLYPYGRAHANPPVTGEPDWDSPRTRELALRACGDCHSNETRWPWYSRVAPASWLVQHDVDEAREHLNFSEFDRPQRDADEAAEEVEEGEMPLGKYLWLHPEARLDERERADLIAGLERTLG